MTTIIEDIRLRENGATWWRTDHFKSPKLIKKDMGDFFHAVLSEGAQVGSTWVFDKYDRSPVYVTVFMTEEMKNNIEAKTKFRFKKPDRIVVN